MDLQGYVKRMKALGKRFDRFHVNVLEEHRARINVEGDGFVPKDMVDLLMNLVDNPNLEVKLDSGQGTHTSTYMYILVKHVCL